jgi:hypothetical protein
MTLMNNLLQGDADVVLVQSASCSKSGRGELDDLVDSWIRWDVELEFLIELAAGQLGLIPEWRLMYSGTNLPPSQCLPLNPFTPSLGAVRLINASGVNVSTISERPFSSGSVRSSCGPSVTDHPEGISTERIGSLDCFIKRRTVWKGGLNGGWNENPGG